MVERPDTIACTDVLGTLVSYALHICQTWPASPKQQPGLPELSPTLLPESPLLLHCSLSAVCSKHECVSPVLDFHPVPDSKHVITCKCTIATGTALRMLAQLCSLQAPALLLMPGRSDSGWCLSGNKQCFFPIDGQLCVTITA